MIVSLVAAMALMAQAAPAAEPAPATPAPSVSTKKKLTKEGMVCRNQPVMGSKLPKKVCSTPQQDAERRAADRELTEYIQQSTRAPKSN